MRTRTQTRPRKNHVVVGDEEGGSTRLDRGERDATVLLTPSR